MKRVLAVVLGMMSMSAMAQTAAPVIPAHGKMVKLFNGKNLKGFDILLKDIGLNKDPDHVFTPENGVLHVSGNGFGGIVTKKEYANYYLRVEFKWGEATWRERKTAARDCGILYSITGPLLAPPEDVWPSAIEFQIGEGSTGDMWLIKGPSVEVNGKVVASTAAIGNQYKKVQRRAEFDTVKRMNTTGYRDPANEIEKPRGEWNVLEMVLAGDHVTYYVNGKLANEATDVSPVKGKILFQTEGSETFYRNMEIAKLK